MSGRLKFPRIVQYRTRDAVHDLPPHDQPYTLVIHDLAAYERLARDGWLYSVEHRGPREPMIDARRT